MLPQARDMMISRIEHRIAHRGALEFHGTARAGTEGSPGYWSACFQLLQFLLSRLQVPADSFSIVIQI